MRFKVTQSIDAESIESEQIIEALQAAMVWVREGHEGTTMTDQDTGIVYDAVGIRRFQAGIERFERDAEA